MELQLIKQPHSISFTGSPMPFSFAVSPYAAGDTEQDIRVQVALLIEKNFNSNLFTEEYVEEFYPTDKGIVNVELQSVIDPFLNWFIPDINQSHYEIASGQYCRYKLQYKLIKNNYLIGSVAATDPFFAVKGGMSYAMFNPVQYFSTMNSDQFFLGVNHTAAKIFTDDYQFLYFLVQTENVSLLYTNEFKLYITVTGNDGNTYQKTINLSDDITSPLKIGTIIAFPAGYNQNNMAALLPSGVLPVSYTVIIKQTLGYSGGSDVIIRAQANYIIDHRTFYNTHQLFYFNSAGGLNTLRLRGQIDYEAEYAKQDAERIATPDYFINGVPDARLSTLKPEESQRTKAATGFITKEEAEKLRDVFLSQLRFELKNGNFTPVIIDTSKVSFYSNRDSLISLQMEWIDAFKNSWYTHDEFVTVPASCPAVEKLFASQLSTNILQIRYSLQTPYDRVEVTIDVDGVEEVYVYRGNTNVINQTFANTAVGTGTVPVTVTARTVCNIYSDPVDYGPTTSVSPTVTHDLPPVANDDTFNVPGGLAVAITLPGSILANDYDPDGDAIEATVVTAGATTQSGTIDIDVDGIVTYLPPSPAFTGLDTFVYTMENSGTSVTATATINFNVSNVLNNIYAKIVIRNAYETIGNPAGDPRFGGQFFGEVYIDYFSNPQGSITYDVSGLGLTVNIRKRETNVYPTYSVADTDTSVSGIGNSQLIYSGILNRNWPEGPLQTAVDYTVAFSLRAGTGYIII